MIVLRRAKISLGTPLWIPFFTWIVFAAPAVAQIRIPPAHSLSHASTVAYYVTVPDLHGLGYSDAYHKLEAAHLKLSNDVDEFNCVGSQSPPAGTRVAPNTSVTVQFVDCTSIPPPAVNPPPGTSGTSTGGVTTPTVTAPARPRTVTVPNVVGLAIVAATTRIQEGHLRVSAVDRQESGRPAGTIVGQVPVAGSVVRYGSGVKITAARAPQFVTVPDLSGRTEEQARSVLSGTRLLLGDVRGRAALGPMGRILEQRPSAGAQVAPQTAVEVVISNLELVTVPSVRGMLLPKARSRLERAGLSVGQIRPSVLDPAYDLIVRQVPGAHSNVARGSRIDLTFAHISYVARAWVSDSVITAGDSVTVGVRVTPAFPGMLFSMHFGDSTSSGWTLDPQVRHHFPKAGRYVARVDVRLPDGESMTTAGVPIDVKRNLTPLLVGLVLGATLLWPAWRGFGRLIVPPPSVQLIPRIGGPVKLTSDVGHHPVWSLAIHTPGPLLHGVVDPSNVTPQPIRRTT